ncbi:MAG: hypothetical protein L0271_25745 [Gemmatimonadetes bacterium]|nr:hypothetical protein [Gemmatimonadota bacterium]
MSEMGSMEGMGAAMASAGMIEAMRAHLEALENRTGPELRAMVPEHRGSGQRIWNVVSAARAQR